MPGPGRSPPLDEAAPGPKAPRPDGHQAGAGSLGPWGGFPFGPGLKGAPGAWKDGSCRHPGRAPLRARVALSTTGLLGAGVTLPAWGLYPLGALCGALILIKGYPGLCGKYPGTGDPRFPRPREFALGNALLEQSLLGQRVKHRTQREVTRSFLTLGAYQRASSITRFCEHARISGAQGGKL